MATGEKRYVGRKVVNGADYCLDNIFDWIDIVYRQSYRFAHYFVESQDEVGPTRSGTSQGLTLWKRQVADRILVRCWKSQCIERGEWYSWCMVD